jgi:hypothetical protein
MDTYDKFITFLLFLKIVFIILAVTHFYFKIEGHQNTKKDQQVVYWKERIEFIFIMGMSILIVYLFSPRRGKEITVTGETKVLLFLFGAVMLVTAKWENFFKTSIWFKELQKSLR